MILHPTDNITNMWNKISGLKRTWEIKVDNCMRKLDNRLCNPLMSSWTVQTVLESKVFSSVFRQRGTTFPIFNRKHRHIAILLQVLHGPDPMVTYPPGVFGCLGYKKKLDVTSQQHHLCLGVLRNTPMCHSMRLNFRQIKITWSCFSMCYFGPWHN